MTTITTASTTTDVTRALLGAGVIAGPLFVCTATAQVLTRDGFDLRRHPLSLLALGDHGWIQVINFIIAGVLSLIFAVGVARRLPDGPGSRWAPRLLALYGAGLVIGGFFQGRSRSRLSGGCAGGLSRAAERARRDSCIRATAGLPVDYRGLLRDRPPVRGRGNAAGRSAHSRGGRSVLRAQRACWPRSQRAPLHCGGPRLRLDDRVRRVPAASLNRLSTAHGRIATTMSRRIEESTRCSKSL
jgi:Protein of unknown function (DUF998)